MGIVYISEEDENDFLENEITLEIICLRVTQTQINSAVSLAGFEATARDNTKRSSNDQETRRHWTKDLGDRLDNAVVVDHGPGWAGRVAK